MEVAAHHPDDLYKKTSLKTKHPRKTLADERSHHCPAIKKSIKFTGWNLIAGVGIHNQKALHKIGLTGRQAK